MGASHTTLSSGNAEDWTTLEFLEGTSEGNNNNSNNGNSNNSNNNNNNNSSNNDSNNSNSNIASLYEVDQHLFPGSGRMMRTYRLRHKTNSSTAVVKSMWVSQDHQSIVEKQRRELLRIKAALHGQTHVAPFLHWNLGTYRQQQKNFGNNNALGNNKLMRPVSLVRPHLYTTLSDRLASRPFLTHVEKLWIVCQLLEALQAMHDAGVVHGFLTTENVGLSSWNWLVLLDISSFKARTALPDDDPSQYLYYFQEAVYMDGTSTTTPREKRCYLAPERFYTPDPHAARTRDVDDDKDEEQPPLTTAMDVFSAGCIIMETFLNGERALDLGDLMEYRKKHSSQTLQQKLNKIEFSAVRAACRHMLSVDPSERLSASAYLERLKASELVPESFDDISKLVERVTYLSPDARLAVAASMYSTILWKALGVRDDESAIYLEKVQGPTMTRLEKRRQQQNSDGSDTKTGDDGTSPNESQNSETPEEKKEESLSDTDLFAETEALLKRLESLTFDEDQVMAIAAEELSSPIQSVNPADVPPTEVKRSPMSQSSLVIYLQLVLSTVRHVLRPASKLVALQLMQRIGRYSTDEARLQRIIPVTISLLQDQDPLVRASAIQVLTSMVSIITSFPPSDSKVFPQYIFKRVAHMITDPSLVVRLAFARSVALLAETSHRFLDISHAVRLYDAVGGGGGSGTTSSMTNATDSSNSRNAVFTDDVAKLLDDPSVGGGGRKNTKKLNAADSGMESATSSESAVVGNGRTLISSTYNTELSALHETVSRWVVHITTDQSEHSSPAKRALLGDLARLCNFFGLDGVMAFILPQILSFLNDRKDWQLRAALFENLPSVCHIIGRAATEHFVLPCLETALVDGEETVVSSALRCLSELLRMGLLSRSLHLGIPNPTVTGGSSSGNNVNATSESSSSSPGLLKKYGPLLVHPSADIRLYFIATVNAVCKSLGNPDDEVFVVPILRPFLRFQPSSRHLTTREGLEMCLHPPWTRKRYQNELDKLIAANENAMSPTAGQWTSIAFKVLDDDEEKSRIADSNPKGQSKEGPPSKADMLDSQTEQVRAYLQMLAKRRSFPVQSGRQQAKSELKSAIEGSLKLAQQIKFPRQVTAGMPCATLPSWFSTLRETQEHSGGPASESAAIRSVSALGQIYGLSIMDQSAATASTAADMTTERAASILHSDESKRIEAACAGEWGSETCLDPTLTDTSLLVTKLNALQVPSLPPKLADGPIYSKRGSTTVKASARDTSSEYAEWKPKIDTMVATSRCAPGVGHTSPIVRLVVSNDQRFFVTGSYDSTCRVWELEKADHSNGVLESSITYNGHAPNGEGGPRVNDLSMVEGGHSVISGASDGSVHVWRVDMVSSSSSTKQTGSNPSDARELARVAGSSIVRKAQVDEGEILAVNHFNTSAASIMTYATQKGFVHSWDLRCANEPFVLKNPQDTGYITSMAMGGDRNWMVTGTSKGYIALWDMRFQQLLKLWRHNRLAPVKRLATSFVPAPQTWTSKAASSADSRPFVFAACGPNECSMLDLTDGSCRACFRTIDYGSRYSRSDLQDVPRLDEVPVSHSVRRRGLAFRGERSQLRDVMSSSFLSLNAMVGSIGASDHSFLITGGSDCKIRFWDFAVPSKCYNVGSTDGVQPRFSFDRIGPNQSCRLMLCRQPPNTPTSEVESSKVPRKLLQGLTRPESNHQDSIQDLKVVKSGLLSCSRDCTVKLWR